MIAARAKGVQPMLLTLTIRNIWKPGDDGNPHIERDMGYNDFIREVAAQEHIPVIDIATCEADRLEALGQEKDRRAVPCRSHPHQRPVRSSWPAASLPP